MASCSRIDDAWQEQMASSFGGLSAAPIDGASRGDAVVRGAMTSDDLGDLGVYGIRGTPQVLVKTPTAVRREPSDLVKVCVVVRGTMLVDQNEHQVTARPGQLAVYDTGRPYRLRLDGAWDVRVLTAPRPNITVPAGAFASSMARPIDARHGPASLLTACVEDALSSGVAADTAGHVHAATLALLAGTLSTGEERRAPTDDALVTRVVRFVDGHLDEPLPPARLAREHHVSVRTLHRALQEADTSPGALVRSRRLDAIHRDLTDPGLDHLAITAVAARRGVLDASWLSRAFRARFGASPSQVRRAASSGRP